MTVQALLTASKAAAPLLARASNELKNQALSAIADELEARVAEVLAANQIDMRESQTKLSSSLLDRLQLTEQRIKSLAKAVREVIDLPDPTGKILEEKKLPNGLHLQKVSVPLGVIGVIYEARPNVTIDIAAIALKSGNAVALRGGSAAENTNRVLIDIVQVGLSSVGLPKELVQTVDEFGREGAQQMMQARGLVDVLIPRGSANLIQTVVNESKVPVIETGDGVVHIYVDSEVDDSIVTPIIVNAKAQRPSVCNALETLLIHEAVAQHLLPQISKALVDAGVTIHGCERTQAIISCVPAADDEWEREYLSLDLSVKVVSSLDEALSHIAKYSTHHTESILTSNPVTAERFLNENDSAVVMVNASTRFTDGGEFGFGAEVGISTQKLHARGPMGLRELTSSKWLVRGSGQVRS
ncbi:MAG: glutamate-5-semialdehyde dehydrogenase [Actinobacteria bacterium]|uniref:glutamate-5-semialdehyde dehydrogenase n=1 Tax=freshwater metagenome TaxID=449393 RepID=A0A6J6CEY0_9ZZZZ|nr:glutamate-5-semialdehyde dehydrogenase [Actinomycetota bacterium]